MSEEEKGKEEFVELSIRVRVGTSKSFEKAIFNYYINSQLKEFNKRKIDLIVLLDALKKAGA